MMLQENGGRSEWVGGVRAQMQQDAAWAASAATCSASATAECTYGANDFCSTSTWICRASWEWEPHPDMVDWIGGQMLHCHMHACTEYHVFVNTQLQQASCLLLLWIWCCSQLSWKQRIHLPFKSLLKIFQSSCVSKARRMFRRPCPPPENHYYHFELSCFVLDNYRPMLLLQPTLAEMLWWMRTECAPTSEQSYGRTFVVDDNWFSTVIRLIIEFAEQLKLRNHWFPFHWATLDALLIALRTYIPSSTSNNQPPSTHGHGY